MKEESAREVQQESLDATELESTNGSKSNTSNKKDGDKGKNIIIIILFIVIILLLLKSCAGTDGPAGNFFDLTPDQSVQEGDFDRKTPEEIQAELNRKMQEGMINISMNLNIKFEDGESAGNLLIYNDPDININPQVVEIYRNDTGELIYKSGAIPIGHRVETGKLLVDLDKGDYKCTAYFNSVDPSTGKLLGKAGAEVLVSILN